MIFISLSPDGFRLRFNSAFSAKDNYRTSRMRKLRHLSSKVNVAGRIDNVDITIFPTHLVRLTYRKPRFLFHLQIIHDTFAVMRSPILWVSPV
jgi:hypothetical protein